MITHDLVVMGLEVIKKNSTNKVDIAIIDDAIELIKRGGMNIEKLLEDILLARKEKLIQRVSPNNLVLVMNENSFTELKTWWEENTIGQFPTIIRDYKRYPMNRLYGMDIELRGIIEDFIVEVMEGE